MDEFTRDVLVKVRMTVCSDKFLMTSESEAVVAEAVRNALRKIEGEGYSHSYDEDITLELKEVR